MTAIKRLKGEGEEYRIRTLKNEQLENDKLREEIKELKGEVKKYKDDLEKLKKKKERDISGL